jgi:hypothetical protein
MLRRFGTGPTGGCRLPAACPPFGDPGLRSATVGPGERGFDEPAALRGGLGGLAALQVFALFLRVFAMLAFGGLGGLMAVSTRARRGRELPRFPKGTLPKSWQCSCFGNVPLRRRAGGNSHELVNLRLTRRRKWSQKWLQSVIKFGTVAKFPFFAVPTIARGGGHANAQLAPSHIPKKPEHDGNVSR